MRPRRGGCAPARARLAGSLASAVVPVVLALASAPGPAHAAGPGQVRTYVALDWQALRAQKGAVERGLSPFLGEELRFDAGGLAYRKLSVGARVALRPWLSLAAHYAHATATPAGGPESRDALAVADVLLAWRHGRLQLKNRERSEWHFAQGFYRYRNLVEGLLATPARWLSLFVREEIRVDADQGRVNMNDVGGGLQVVPWPSLVFRIFVDAESSRRSRATWQTTPYLGLSVSGHL